MPETLASWLLRICEGYSWVQVALRTHNPSLQGTPSIRSVYGQQVRSLYPWFDGREKPKGPTDSGCLPENAEVLVECAPACAVAVPELPAALSPGGVLQGTAKGRQAIQTALSELSARISSSATACTGRGPVSSHLEAIMRAAVGSDFREDLMDTRSYAGGCKR